VTYKKFVDLFWFSVAWSFAPFVIANGGKQRCKKRHNYTPEEEIAILKRHLVDHVPFSDLCDECQLQPTILYNWQKQFFEQGAAAFNRQSSSVKAVRLRYNSSKRSCCEPKKSCNESTRCSPNWWRST
jgi:transposase